MSTPAHDWADQLAASLPPTPRRCAAGSSASCCAVDAKDATIGFAGRRRPGASRSPRWAGRGRRCPTARLGPAPQTGRRRAEARRRRRGRGDRRRRRTRPPRPIRRPLTRCARSRRSAAPWSRMDPHTGRVLAMSGGWSFESERVQPRDPGEAPAGLVVQAVRLSDRARERLHARRPWSLDAPIVDRPGPGPAAVAAGATTREDFLGAATAAAAAREVAQPDDRAPRRRRSAWTRSPRRPSASASSTTCRRRCAMALGAGETTLLRLTAAYCDARQRRQEDRADADRPRAGPHGKTIYRARPAACDGCRQSPGNGQPPPELPDTREQVADPRTAYQMVIDAGRRGAARHRHGGEGGRQAARRQDRHHQRQAATPGSSASRPTWWPASIIGFDQPRTLGPKETGGSIGRADLPRFHDGGAEGRAGDAVPHPAGLRMVRVNPPDGPARQAGEKAIWEAFKPGTEPGRERRAAGADRHRRDGDHRTGRGGRLRLDVRPAAAPAAARAGCIEVSGDPATIEPGDGFSAVSA